MGLPPILAARTAKRFNRLLARAAGKPALSFAPSHALVDFDSDFARDLIGNWHLYRTCGDASAPVTSYGGGMFVRRALSTVLGSADTWIAGDVAHYNFGATSWAMILVSEFLALGIGGLYLSNVRGPAPDDPFNNPGHLDDGPDRGHGISANGDGGIGFLVYGSGGYLNADTAPGTINLIGTGPRALAFGYSAAAKIAYLTGSNFNIAYAGDAGDLTSPDMFAFRSTYFNAMQCGATQRTSLLAVIDDPTAAENVYQYRIGSAVGLGMVAMLQEQL